MAQEESSAVSNVLLILILVAVLVMGSFWIYRQMGAAPTDRDPGVKIELGGGNSAAPSQGY